MSAAFESGNVMAREKFLWWGLNKRIREDVISSQKDGQE